MFIQASFLGGRSCNLTRKLDRLRTELLEFRRKFNDDEPHWRDEGSVRSRYRKLCEEMYISTKFFDLKFNSGKMTFRKNTQEIDSARAMMGKNFMEEMHALNCVLTWAQGVQKPELGLEEPTSLQAEILKGIGYVIQEAWVLQTQH